MSMAHGILPRIGGTGGTALPPRGKALMKISLVDENGFSYEYRELEVDMSLARETIAQLHLHDDLNNASRGEETAPKARRRRGA